MNKAFTTVKYREARRKIRMRKASVYPLLAIALLMLAGPAAVFASATGTIDYYVSYGTCSSTWGGGSAADGNPPGIFNNNLGTPNVAPIIGTGSICVRVVLTGATPLTKYQITNNNLNGFLNVNTDASGNGDNYTLFTSVFAGQCVTSPFKLSPETPYSLTGGQIGHVWVGTGTDTTGQVNCSSGRLVPEFPLGLFLLLVAAIPGVFFIRRRAFQTRLA